MRTHKRRFVRVVGFVLLGCVFFASGFIFTQTNVTRGATTTYLLANYDLDKMVERSDLIIGGEILSISDPFWDENNSSIIIAIFKIKAYSRMNGTNLHSPVELQPEMHAESHLEEHPMSLL